MEGELTITIKDGDMLLIKSDGASIPYIVKIKDDGYMPPSIVGRMVADQPIEIEISHLKNTHP